MVRYIYNTNIYPEYPDETHEVLEGVTVGLRKSGAKETNQEGKIDFPGRNKTPVPYLEYPNEVGYDPLEVLEGVGGPLRQLRDQHDARDQHPVVLLR